MTKLRTAPLALAGLAVAALVGWSAPALASHGADDPTGHDRHHHGHHGHHHGHHGHGADDPAGRH
ncbi:MAG TPA: hypothetical protein VFT70_05990 [Nocardioides sp.]|nr:hypothetical protein [Nocardioides sp.]